jgi:hypothetical protein
MVNLTKGEGYGRPLLEFSLTKKPIITTNWSGQVDFLNYEFTTLLPGKLTDVHPSAANQWLLKESQWFSVDLGHTGTVIKDVFEDYKKYLDGAKRQAHKSKTEFSWDKMKDKVDELFTKYIPEFPKQVELKLPTLKKIELNLITKNNKIIQKYWKSLEPYFTYTSENLSPGGDINDIEFVVFEIENKLIKIY